MKASSLRICGTTWIAVVLLIVAKGAAFADEKKSADSNREDVEVSSGQAPTDELLVSRSYRIPPVCTFGPRSPGSRPKQILQLAGITFGPGSEVRFDSLESILTIRNTPDQLELVEDYIESFSYSREKEVTAIIEFIEVDARTLSDWVFENRLDTDGTPLRKMLQGLVREGTARVVETSVIVCRSGQRARTESLSQVTYASELEQPELPDSVSLSGGSEAAEGAVMATATEYRNVGITTEVDVVIYGDEVTLDLSLSPSIIAEGEPTVWPNAEVDANSRQEMPSFYRSQISTAVTLKDGRYAFLGTSKPRRPSLEGVDDSVLAIFVRGDISRLENAEASSAGVNE